MAQSLVCADTVSRVSSVLNRNTRQFGKKHLFDQDEETCWNSDQVLRGVRLSVRLWTSTLKTTTPFRPFPYRLRKWTS
uniref:Nuclear receptor 2C2 associated protein n=1 Tax=Pipistrellus kuhlii TaxID=59472 RepID=A0A7J7UAL9_PIPKU|nr:nuclear receptor 2C2 associated protein [Pipistrellus kuhlii]